MDDGTPRMLETHDLLPVTWHLAVPEPVCRRLLDMGIACNKAALAFDQAYLQHRYSVDEFDSATACADGARHRAEFARQWFDCTVSYTDQLAAVYTVTASIFAGYATEIAAEYASEGRIPLSEPALLPPSVVLREPDTYLPLVQMPAGAHAPQPIAEHNTELATSHRGLMDVIELTLRSHPVDVYDVPSRLANRPPMSLGLNVDLACCLHSYAANCAWAVGLATRPVDDAC